MMIDRRRIWFLPSERTLVNVFACFSLQHVFGLLEVFDRPRTSDEHSCLQFSDQILDSLDNGFRPLCSRFQERFRQPAGEGT